MAFILRQNLTVPQDSDWSEPTILMPPSLKCWDPQWHLRAWPDHYLSEPCLQLDVMRCSLVLIHTYTLHGPSENNPSSFSCSEHIPIVIDDETEWWVNCLDASLACLSTCSCMCLACDLWLFCGGDIFFRLAWTNVLVSWFSFVCKPPFNFLTCSSRHMIT